MSSDMNSRTIATMMFSKYFGTTILGGVLLFASLSILDIDFIIRAIDWSTTVGMKVALFFIVSLLSLLLGILMRKLFFLPLLIGYYIFNYFTRMATSIEEKEAKFWRKCLKNLLSFSYLVTRFLYRDKWSLSKDKSGKIVLVSWLSAILFLLVSIYFEFLIMLAFNELNFLWLIFCIIPIIWVFSHVSRIVLKVTNNIHNSIFHPKLILNREERSSSYFNIKRKYTRQLSQIDMEVLRLEREENKHYLKNNKKNTSEIIDKLIDRLPFEERDLLMTLHRLIHSDISTPFSRRNIYLYLEMREILMERRRKYISNKNRDIKNPGKTK